MTAQNRLSASLKGCIDRGEKAMGLFLTNGYPEIDAALPILLEVARSGADFIELGMPFSDPLAEGLPVQHSSERALRNGVRMEGTFETAAAFRKETDTPLLLMGYINPIYRYGVRRFCRDARDAGVDGVILPDLPPEENAIIAGEAAQAGLALVNLIAPNTPDARIQEIDSMSTGFIYAVSITGLTGSGLGAVESVESYLRRARALVSKNPLLVGFGIRSAEDARRLSAHTDGFIVGSALIQLVEKLWEEDLPQSERLRRIADFVQELKHGGRSSAEATVRIGAAL